MLHAPRAPAPGHDQRFAARWTAAIDDRWPDARRRAGGLALALALEAALLLVLLTLGASPPVERTPGETLTTVDFTPAAVPEPTSAEPESPASKTPSAQPAPAEPHSEAPPPSDQPDRSALPFPVPPPAAVIPRAETPAPAPPPAPRIRAVVRGEAQGTVGPPATSGRGDSQRVGSRPNGEPVYAARWYREPTDGELRGYLSTASGPGWALITCRTVPDYRVEDCELEDEYPSGAQIGRAVLAAAWQFRVRPPQIGGRVLVGEWVRIRIIYEQRAR